MKLKEFWYFWGRSMINVSWAVNHDRMISEGSCDTEDWWNYAENSALHHSNKLHFKIWNRKVHLKCCNLSQFYCIFDQINVALVNARHKNFFFKSYQCIYIYTATKKDKNTFKKNTNELLDQLTWSEPALFWETNALNLRQVHVLLKVVSNHSKILNTVLFLTN